MKKSALIYGITGQDGSYLAEFLLEKGYDVHGVIRRASTFNTGRIDHILDEPNFHFHHGDVTDANNVNATISKLRPDEIYNLSAQSHVRVSFDLPHYTAEVDALGTLNILEAIRQHSPKTKIYQASTSELYGGMDYNRPKNGYNESSPMHPRSPYGCAKIYGYWIIKNYRESYNMFACNGILFNHECISENSPIIIRSKKNNNIDITTIKNYKTYKKKGANKQQWLSFDDEMWDGEKFVDIKCITATKIEKNNDDHKILIQNTRNGSVETTAHHNLLNSNNEKVKSRDVNVGDSLKMGEYPKLNSDKSLTKEEAMFLGLMVGDGYVSKDGDSASFTNNNSVYLDLMKELWCKISNGYVSDVKENKTEYGYNKSISLLGDSLYLKRLRNEIYSKDSFKKIPLSILNTDRDNKIEFLKGYNISDGLKSNPCVYEFKNFKSNSSVLAQGLLTLVNNVLNQKYNLTVETKVVDDKTRTYYSINLLTDKQDRTEEINEMLSKGISQRKIAESLNVSRSTISKIAKGEEVYKNSHLLKDDRESVKKKIENENHVYEYVYDIEVDTGRVMSGVGNVVIANSPRRGETFVTRKITRGLAQIFNGKKETPLSMGNLDSLRDWGHAYDYIKGMYLMLQQDNPDDYVLATNETHSVREFIEICCDKLGYDLEWNGEGVDEYGVDKKTGKVLININPKYYRPAEVDILLGDYSKAKKELGWKPEISFKELVTRMLENDLKNEK